ncbi:MAG: KTSC domain-containing protein [Rhodocyclaceae bacterium]|nr:KTSC domain-containing protein [Rhodocyclaceae bacterium]
MSETVFVKYQGQVSLDGFSCMDVNRSSFIRRVCYHDRKMTMVASLSGTYYAFCGVPGDVHQFFVSAPSMGKYFNSYIKGRYRCD